MRVSDLAKIFTICHTSIASILLRFHAQKKNLAAFTDGRFTRTRFTKLTPYMQAFLRRRRTLQDWAGKSLRERCILIQNRFNIVMGAATLQAFYLKHRISYRKSQMVYRQALVSKPSHD